MTRKAPKPTIRQNAWDNWNGYVGGKKVKEFGTDKLAAEQWLEDQQVALPLKHASENLTVSKGKLVAHLDSFLNPSVLADDLLEHVAGSLASVRVSRKRPELHHASWAVAEMRRQLTRQLEGEKGSALLDLIVAAAIDAVKHKEATEQFLESMSSGGAQ